MGFVPVGGCLKRPSAAHNRRECARSPGGIDKRKRTGAKQLSARFWVDSSLTGGLYAVLTATTVLGYRSVTVATGDTDSETVVTEGTDPVSETHRSGDRPLCADCDHEKYISGRDIRIPNRSGWCR